MTQLTMKQEVSLKDLLKLNDEINKFLNTRDRETVTPGSTVVKPNEEINKINNLGEKIAQANSLLDELKGVLDKEVVKPITDNVAKAAAIYNEMSSAHASIQSSNINMRPR